MKQLCLISLLLLLKITAYSAVENTNWNTGCLLVGDDVIQSEIQFSKNQMSINYTAYEKEGCQIPYIIYQENYFYKTQDKNLNLQTDSITYQALSDEVARAMNTIAFCGFIDWQKNIVKDVAGLLCDDRHLPLKGEVIYSIIEQNESELQIGESFGKYDGHTEQFRHQKFGDLIWNKKN